MERLAEYGVYWPHMAAVLTVSAMVGTAVHVLLHKRDARAAVGWLGLVWFAPVLGVCLYWLFGINRVRRRAQLLFAGREAAVLPASVAAVTPGELKARVATVYPRPWSARTHRS